MDNEVRERGNILKTSYDLFDMFALILERLLEVGSKQSAALQNIPTLKV
jgi:hypothetical protein